MLSSPDRGKQIRKETYQVLEIGYLIKRLGNQQKHRIFNKASWKPIETFWGVSQETLKRLEGNKDEIYCIAMTFF